MNYTIHRMTHRSDGTILDEVLATADNVFALACAAADTWQRDAIRLGQADAFQVREENGRLVYWTSLTHPYWQESNQS